MKDIRPALREFLLGDAGIAAIVVARIYPVKIPQGIMGASVVYTKISGFGDYHTQGPSGLAHPRYQLGSWATSGDAAAALANLVKDRLDGYSGPMGSGANLVTVQGVFMADERETYDDVVQLFGVSRDYFIWNSEL